MFCSKCGKEMRAGARFCSGCGERLETAVESVSTTTQQVTNTEIVCSSGSIVNGKGNDKIPVIAESKKRTPIFLWIGIAAILIVAAVVITVFIKSSGSSEKRYREKMDLGRKYLLELDYEQAILCFEEAINIDPKSKEAYLELAEVYVKQGKNEKALEILEEARNKINDTDDINVIKKKENEIDNEIRNKVTPEPTPMSVKVPNVIGYNVDDAISILTATSPDFVIKWLDEEYSDEVEKGFIVKQDPEVTTSVERNAVINLTVSAGSKPHEEIAAYKNAIIDLAWDSAEFAVIDIDENGIYEVIVRELLHTEEYWNEYNTMIFYYNDTLGKIDFGISSLEFSSVNSNGQLLFDTTKGKAIVSVFSFSLDEECECIESYFGPYATEEETEEFFEKYCSGCRTPIFVEASQSNLEKYLSGNGKDTGLQ